MEVLLLGIRTDFVGVDDGGVGMSFRERRWCGVTSETPATRQIQVPKKHIYKLEENAW